jgi:hypothetical protein
MKMCEISFESKARILKESKAKQRIEKKKIQKFEKKKGTLLSIEKRQ